MFFCVIFSDRCLCSATVCSPTNLLLNYFWIFFNVVQQNCGLHLFCMFMGELYIIDLLQWVNFEIDKCNGYLHHCNLETFYKMQVQNNWIIIYYYYYFFYKSRQHYIWVCVCMCVIIRWKYGLILLCFL